MKMFNEAQQRAIQHGSGPALILAGPGSGKTTVITERIRYLIQKRGICPQNILVITFTNAAATEMRLRFQGLMNKENPGENTPVSFGTFHSVFFAVLRSAYNYRADNILRDNVKQQILYELAKDIQDMDAVENSQELIADLETEISRIKNERLELSAYYARCCGHEDFRRIYAGYEKELRKRNLIDFDDMLVYCYELFARREDILARWQKQYPYILIDEFQDINRLQYDIIRMMAKPHNNLFIVGDDDQSIYRFRGASPEIMLNFPKDYPGTEKILLNVNYRCPGQVTELAGKLIAHNRNRFAKEMVSVQEGGQNVPTVTIRRYENTFSQNESIANQISQYHKEGISYSHMSVLFRTNTQARLLAAKLMEHNIPFSLKEAVPNMYNHWVAKDIYAYIKIASGDNAREHYLRIANRPLRYIKRDAFVNPVVDFEDLYDYYQGQQWMEERLEDFETDLARLADMDTYGAISYIRRIVGYDAYVQEYAREHRTNVEELTGILDEMAEQAKEQTTFREWFSYIQDYGEMLKKQSEEKKKKDSMEDKDQVILGTMHGAKGLEYEVVFIPDAVEGVTPYNKAVLDADMEEERRMFYVAMTRAKSRLHISTTRQRFDKNAEDSRFIQEIME